jgi:hypothetical protein
MIKVFNVVFAILFFGASASADLLATVDWTVGPVAIKIYTKDFQISSVVPRLTCHLTDGSGASESFPEISLDATVTEDTSFSGQGHMYSVAIEGGHLHGQQWLAELRSCTYAIDVYSDLVEDMGFGEFYVKGRVGLARADDLTGVKDFVRDETLNEKISEKNAIINLRMADNKTAVIIDEK